MVYFLSVHLAFGPFGNLQLTFNVLLDLFFTLQIDSFTLNYFQLTVQCYRIQRVKI